MRSLTASTIVAFSLLIGIFALQSVGAVDYRLSTNVRPELYDITITPYFLPEDGDKRFTFDGETWIIIKSTTTDVREFAVHADYLEFTELGMWAKDGTPVPFTTEYEAITDKLIFRLEEGVLTSYTNYSLHFKYTGRISSGTDGLYRINYTDDTNNERWMVATQLQRIEARKVFPCFDEPGFKSNFDIHINRPATYRSYSNTNIYAVNIDSNDRTRYVDHYKTSPYMSTYLVAMVVADYKTRGDESLSIISRPQWYGNTEFSYDVSNKFMTHYGELFGRGYSSLGNPIMQKISVSKFPHNGMENWGLMIYKDEVLIYEEGSTDLSGKQYTITIVSHETSHSWFGDAITFQWWGYFWLNEGFARYYQYFATNTIYPEYELDKQFVVDQLQNIFNTDALISTQPLSEPDVASPAEIGNKFSTITYMKGASIIRMISNAMSDSLFKSAIKRYIANNINKSVIPSNLFDVLTLSWPSVPRVDSGQFLIDWTEQVGFPLLTVKLADDKSSVTVTQKRYLLNPDDGSDPTLRYTIPLTYASSIEPDFTDTYPVKYFNKDDEKVVFSFASPVEWVMFNVQQTGYYRVMYDNSSWYDLHNALYKDNWSGIHEINRAQFVDDLLAFARASLIEYDMVFKLLEYLETEIQYTPWNAAFTGFKFIGQFLTVEDHKDFGSYILFVTEKVFNNLGVSEIKDESVLDVYNRKQVVNFNCKYGRTTCITEVQKNLRNFLNNGVIIPVDMRATVYCSGMRDASEADFEKLLNIWKSEKLPRERTRMINGLGCVRNSKNVKRFFDVVLSDVVLVDDKADAMAPLYKENPENVWPVYEMVTTRVEEVAKAFESWSRTANLISNIASLLTTVEQRDKFKEFIKENRSKFDTSAEILDNGLETLDSNLEWTESHLIPLRKYLQSRNGATTKLISLLVLTLSFISSYVLF